MFSLMAITGVATRGWATPDEAGTLFLVEVALLLVTTIGFFLFPTRRLVAAFGVASAVALTALAFTQLQALHREIRPFAGKVVQVQRIPHGRSATTSFLRLQNAQGEWKLAIDGTPGDVGWVEAGNQVRYERIFYRTPWDTEVSGEMLHFQIIDNTNSDEAPASSR
jgi:hypothetical protein